MIKEQNRTSVEKDELNGKPLGTVVGHVEGLREESVRHSDSEIAFNKLWKACGEEQNEIERRLTKDTTVP